jgi:hypothetical protein
MTDDMLDHLLGEGINVVVLRTAGDHAVPVVGKTPFDLARDKEPAGDLLSEILGSTIRVTAAEGTPGAVLAMLKSIHVPPAFRVSPWLADTRPVMVGDDGTGQVGDFPIRYTDDHGLQILYPDSALDESDDDLDDSADRNG